MKHLLSFLLLLIFAGQLFAQDFTAMTYNIRYDNPRDGINRWDNRKEWIVNQIKEYKPDFLGTQEGLHHQVQYLDSSISVYDYVGAGRDDGKTKGEYAALFYNTARYFVIEKGTFWLSETPEKPSVGWDASMERICTYALFQDESTNRHIWVFNAHLDHKGEKSRLESLKLIWKKLDELNTKNYPAVILGDFNADPGSEPISFLSSKMKEAKAISHAKPKGPTGTFNGFNPDSLSRRLDYIFASDQLSVESHATINEIINNRTPSDHLPVFATFKLKKP